jgi:hypothetical protein
MVDVLFLQLLSANYAVSSLIYYCSFVDGKPRGRDKEPFIFVGRLSPEF